MTDTELCRDFLQAGDRKRQIKILSQLTLRPPDAIRAVLTAYGINPDAPAPKPPKLQNESTGREIMLPAAIRKEVFEHVNYSGPKRRVKRL